MPKKKFISVKEAQSMAKARGMASSVETVMKYVKILKIGHQTGGPKTKWYINPDKWKDFLNGEIKVPSRTTKRKIYLDE